MNNFKYTKDHEWVALDGNVATIGITTYAQNSLGDLVYVELPEVGKNVKKGDDFAVVESVKAASEVYTPISGEIVAVNDDVVDNPELVKEDIDTGWLAKIKVTDNNELSSLMDHDQYKKFIEEE